MPKKKAVDLTNVKEVDLLQATAEILLRAGPVSDRDQEELEAINREFTRRESLSLV